METVKSKDGTAIAYSRNGSGPSLIIVNGALSDHNSVSPLLPYLTDHFTVYSYDRRGRSNSGDTKPYSVDKEIDDLKSIAALADHPLYVFGHSSGAMLLLQAVISGLKTEKIVLYEPPYAVSDSIRQNDLAERLSSLIELGNREGALTTFFKEAFGFSDELIKGMELTPQWKHMMELANTLPYDVAVSGDRSFPKETSELQIPALVLLGGSSPSWMKASMESLSKFLPKGELVVLAGQSHNAQPAILSKELIGFLER